MNFFLNNRQLVKTFWLVVCILIQSPTAQSQALQSESKPVLIPAGEFLMGTEDGTEIERPVHKVFLREYKIDRHEVSNQEFEMLQPDHPRSAASVCDRCPVTLVTWFEASAYCEIRGGRLPTEAEWERAGRGPDGFSYSFGPTADKGKGHFGREFQAGAKPVDSFQPNSFGLYNMSGNVWEWVNDQFSFYPQAATGTAGGRRTSREKIVRGGSWYNEAYYVNVGMRFRLKPGMKLNSIGFRCAWDAE